MHGPGWRALLAPLAAAVGLQLAGCSLALDFSPLGDAGPDTDTTDSCAAFEPNDSPGEAAAIEDSGNSAAICLADPPDVDFFRFSTSGGQDVVVRLTMPDGTGPLNLNLRVYDDAENLQDESTEEAEEETVEFVGGAQLAAGDYLVEVFGAAPGNINEYTLTVTQTAP